MWNNTPVSQKLQIEYPIIQGPFGGRFSSVKLVTTVSNLGGMGSFGLNAYGPEEILEINEEIATKTSNTYALNLWVPLQDDPVHYFSPSDFEQVRSVFKPYFDQLKIPVPNTMALGTQSFERQIEAVIKARPPVVSFIFGIPSKRIIKALKSNQIIIMAVATNIEEAIKIKEAGLDVVIASGMEAGGHRAAFLGPAEDSLISTLNLVHLIREKVNLPIIAAGGISTGQDIVEMLRLGAGAAQLGTAFLATDESNAPLEHRERLLSKKKFETQLTKVFTGRLARVIQTEFTRNMGKDMLTAPYPIQSGFLGSLRTKAKEESQMDFEAWWAGQPSNQLIHKSTSDLFKSLVEEVEFLHNDL